MIEISENTCDECKKKKDCLVIKIWTIDPNGPDEFQEAAALCISCIQEEFDRKRSKINKSIMNEIIINKPVQWKQNSPKDQLLSIIGDIERYASNLHKGIVPDISFSHLQELLLETIHLSHWMISNWNDVPHETAKDKP